jgi:hypothetical protein
MLFRHAIIVKTDHKNLIHQLSAHTEDCLLHQHCLLNEYGVELQYIEGEKNIVADTLSCIQSEEILKRKKIFL